MPYSKKRDIVIKTPNNDIDQLRINQLGVYQIKEGNSALQKKIFCVNSKLRVRIVKIELHNTQYRFTVRFNDQNASVLGLIEGTQQFENFMKVIGLFVPINGLQQIATVFKKTGEGSFAQVFEIITNFQSHFAVKCFEKRQLQKCQKSSKAFHNEIDILKKLNSPFIVSYDYVFQTQKAYYLKMQFFTRTLKQKIKQKMLVKQQKLIMKQLLMALKELKNKNVIHRDLKPDNIMLRTNRRGEQQCVIIDFGLSTLVDAPSYIFLRCGTPGFLAPEIANLSNRNQKQKCSADMFSLGCIFYKILTGHYLFSGKTGKDVLKANKDCTYDPHKFQKLSQMEKTLLKRMLEPDPNKRITPEQALKNSYFQDDIDDDDEIPQQQCKINEKVKKIAQNTLMKCMDSINSLNSVKSFNSVKSLTSQAYKQRKYSLIRDSCLTFEFKSKENTEKQNSLSLSKVAVKQRGKSQRKSRFSGLPMPQVI